LGTDQDIGKTVTSIGIIAKLLSADHGYAPEEIGYIKPVGQQTLTIVDEHGASIEADKDAVLITQLMGIVGPGYDRMSPVVWGGGVTADFIDRAAAGDPLAGREVFLERIRAAYTQGAAAKRIVIVEGTGQPGVGSVAGISNADVINALREMGVPVFVVMVTRAGIGATIDQVFPYLLALDHMGTRVDGLIMNDVLVPKMPKIRQYLETYYQQVLPALYGSRLQAQGVPPSLGFGPRCRSCACHHALVATFPRQRNSGIEMVTPSDPSTGATS
jgi:dethiobiotin synthetase